MPEPAYDASAGAGGDPRVAAGGEPPVRTTSGPEFALRPDGDRVVVAVRGELDLESTEQLEHALRAALAATVGRVDLDLGEVTFCDCAALNVLLSLRERGLKCGKTVAVRSAGPVVERLLTLTGTADLFDEPLPDPGPDPAPGSRRADRAVGRSGPGGEDTVSSAQDARIEVVQLRRAMQTRPVIDLARGILMASFALSAEDAWRVLVETSQHTNTKLHHLARDLVTAVQGEPPTEAVQEQVAAAVARVRSEPSTGDGIPRDGQ
ncbi:ANTAR domain-containing protein [Streptomyces sp. NPDC006527]|uniref:ANTAR domain-containing protein n=1 Tax=Streptomyces sp. NPDC006527 TaxID=3364749 RepID=UPI0036ADB3A6